MSKREEIMELRARDPCDGSVTNGHTKANIGKTKEISLLPWHSARPLALDVVKYNKSWSTNLHRIVFTIECESVAKRL